MGAAERLGMFNSPVATEPVEYSHTLKSCILKILLYFYNLSLDPQSSVFPSGFLSSICIYVYFLH